MDLKIREMVATINKYIDGLDLPMEVKRMAVKEIYDEAAKKADEAVMAEIAERDAMESKKASESAAESAQTAKSSELME